MRVGTDGEGTVPANLDYGVTMKVYIVSELDRSAVYILIDQNRIIYVDIAAQLKTVVMNGRLRRNISLLA